MPKRDSGGKESIPRLIRSAFEAARAGNKTKANEFWQAAIDRGYEPPVKTVRNLQKVFRRAVDQGSQQPL